METSHTTSLIKVLLVDDHVLVRMGLTEAIEANPHMKVVGEASCAAELLSVYGEACPDVVVMDFRMPGGSGAEATAGLLKLHPQAKVLIMSVYEGEEDVWRAVSAGAMGYLSKGVDAADLVDAIAALAVGSRYFPARIAQKLETRKNRQALTKRESTVLEMLVQGLSNKEIAQDLSISLATVKLHVSNLFEKMGVEDRTQAAMAAVQRGVVHLDD